MASSKPKFFCRVSYLDSTAADLNVPLLCRVAGGDRDAVKQCISRYGGLVWNLARRLCSNTSDLDDAVQEIFIDLWSSAGKFDATVSSEKTFIAMIARRRLIDRFRRQQRSPSLQSLETPIATESNHLRQSEIREEADKAAGLIATFSPDQQKVLRLAVCDGWPHRKIADHLNMPLGTVKSHVRRGLIRLREQMEEKQGHEVGGSS